MPYLLAGPELLGSSVAGHWVGSPFIWVGFPPIEKLA